MRNLHKDLKENYGLEALQLLQVMGERCNKGMQLQKPQTILTLRCISKDLVPVSVKLRSAYSKISQGTRKIIEKAEK